MLVVTDNHKFKHFDGRFDYLIGRKITEIALFPGLTHCCGKRHFVLFFDDGTVLPIHLDELERAEKVPKAKD